MRTRSRRAHVRHALGLAGILRWSAGETACRTENVSQGGALLHVGDPVPFGAEVLVIVPLAPLREVAELAATVRWVHGDAVGVQWTGLRAKHVWALHRLFERLPSAAAAT